ncbi:AAA family ATPase [Rhizobium leguminosarum]|uniref:AAA family ATPase n=1 Tax=Rhizobium leguminosarum TaxID=384 RepID=UPI001CDC0449|nr:AAA family ATPase [Rhizobium leguminosarum]MCA2431205.1 AAA family ATPase [Rhizobium leguminosarum]
MTQPVVVTHILRSQPPIVFSAQTIEGKTARFVDKEQVLGREPIVGETWEVTGMWQVHPEHGRQVALTQAVPSRPTGRLFIQTVSGHKSFPGIGVAKAQRLWDLHGEAIYALLDAGSPSPFIPLVGSELAEVLLSGWSGLGTEASTYRWLTSLDLSPKLAERIIAIYSGLPVPPEHAEEARAVGAPIWHLQRDPYRMLAFADWQSVDRAADSMGIGIDDKRRLVGAIEAALIKRLHANHTWTSGDELVKLANRFLNGSGGSLKAAVQDAVDAGAIVPVGDGFELAGCEIMERFCAERLSLMAAGKFEATQLSLRRLWSDREIETELDAFDQSEGYTLNAEQRRSVHAAVLHRVSLLLGGPGVGKTTALKAIHHVAEKMQIVVHQAALSGRASQRMREATSRAANTIAALLVRVDKGEIELGDGVLLILDECSMIDLGTLYRLVSHFKPGVRILFVGDPGQLPPIGFGLTFHILVDAPQVPKTELTMVMRQTAESGIPQVCAAIRVGRPPKLLAGLANREGVAFLNTKTDEVFDQVMDVLAKLGGIRNAQIIGSVKRGPAGTFEINRQLQALAGIGKQLLCGRFFAGEPIIATRNDYDIGIMNGDLGSAIGETQSRELEADFSGRRIVIPQSYLPNVELAYAITCHKSQGSQFERVIIPITRNRLMDRTLLLTAVSRGQKQVFLIGERSVFDSAITAPPLSNQRQVGLRHHLSSMRV